MSHSLRLQRGGGGGKPQPAAPSSHLLPSSLSAPTPPPPPRPPSKTPPYLPSPSRTRQFLSAPSSPSTSTPMPPPTTTTATPNIHPTSNITASAAAAAAPTPAAAAATTAHEKMWHEMQQKLEEVSLSGDHVFGSTHSKSLASLRTAQVELAQAWMRSEEDDLDNKHTVFGHQAFAPAASGAGGGAAASSSAAAVQEQDEDLLLAGERRRANDAHFARVAMSVVDVTRRLENVARAMAGVELESRGIWAGSSDSDVSSLLS